MLLYQRRMDWQHVAAPRAWQAFNALRLQLDEIAAATAAMAYCKRSRAMKCLQADAHEDCKWPVVHILHAHGDGSKAAVAEPRKIS